MATYGEQNIKDPREIGTSGLSGLERPDGLHFGRSAQEYKALQQIRETQAAPIEYLGNRFADAGTSKYDTGVRTIDDLQNLSELRAQEQPWYDQIANGALKMVTTAATTFIDGTLGTLWGIGTGVTNWFDDDPSTGFWRGMWDNAITNAMADVNDKMEEVAHNYRSAWEQNASVFERMFSAAGAANFWGDDILKNAGFTMGAAASIWATGGLGGALKSIPSLGRFGKTVGLLSQGEKGLEATKAGKAASWIAKTFTSTQGEAAIESINSMRESLKALDAEELAMRKEGEENALAEYQTNINGGMSAEAAQLLYQDRLDKLDSDIESYKTHMQQELSDAGNMIYAANIAALSISNNLTLGSMIRGGYGNAKSLLSQATKTANGKPIETAREAGEALLKGELRFAAPEVSNKTAKALGHWALTSTQEGLEEGVQNLASNTGQIAAAARGHKWAKDNTMLGSLINPEAEDDLTSYSSALGKAYEEQFGHLNSPGWTEVVAGFITGALGVASMHRNSEGKIRPTWQGGIKESWETITGNQKAVQAQADALNKALTDNKFQDRVRHAVQQIAIKKGQEDALERGDVQAYKNYEVQQLLSDAVFFRDMGMLDDYLAMYEAMGENVSDQDVAELKAMAKQENGEASSLESMTDDDIKTLYKDKANSALEKIKESLKDYKAIEDQYGDKFSDETRREATMEMAFLNTLYWDTLRRREEINGEIEELESKSRTPLEDLEMRMKKLAANALDKQAVKLRDTLNEYKNSPQTLQKEVEEKQSDRLKANLYKKAEAAIAKYKEAETLQDVADVYSHSPEGDREQVLNQAIEQTEGETKEKLQQFKNYMGDVNTLEHVIEDRLPIEGLNNPIQAHRNKGIRDHFMKILYGTVKEMLSDNSAVPSRATLKEKLNNVLKEFTDELAERKAQAEGVTMGENGVLDFSAAFDSGAVSEDDFDEILDDEATGKSHREVKAGSKAEELAEAARGVRQAQELVDDMQYFVDSLDKLDELRDAAKKKEKKKEKKGPKKKGEKPEVEVEVIEGEDESEGGEDDSLDLEEAEDEDEDSEPPVKPKSKKGTKSLLTDEESTAYKVGTKKGASGITYNTVQKTGVENKKAKESVAKKLDKVDQKLERYMDIIRATDSEKQKQQQLISDMLDVIANNLVGNKTIAKVEAFFKKNAKYLKTTSGEDEALPPHDEDEGSTADSQVSMNGNQFPAYVKSELENGKMVHVTHQKSGEEPLQVWLENEGFNVQEIIDNYLGKVVEGDAEKAVKDKTPIHYIHTNEKPNTVFLGIEYAKVEDLIPRDVAKKLIQGQDGKNYLIVGTFGWEAARKGTKDMFGNILNIVSDGEHTSDGWYVDIEHTNRIKDIRAGEVVKQIASDSSSHPRDLKELLKAPRNPHNLELEDISWTVLQGEEGKLKRVVINGESSKVYAIRGGRPGQVYLNVPASNGNFVPVYMETMFFEELDSDTPLYKEIMRNIEILADPNTTMQDKKSAIAVLNDYLVFSKGVNQIHLNDEKSKIDPNTIYVTKDGQAAKVLDFEEDDSDDFANRVLEAILSINPRINLSITALDRNPKLYLDSGVLKTDIGMLGTVGSSFFVYPVDSDGTYIENKPFKGTGKTYDASVKTRIYVGGKYVYYDGNKFTDEKGSRVTDDDGTLAAALKIKSGKIKPIKVGKSKADYYVVDGTVYVDNGHGGINVVGEELSNKVLEVSKGKKGKEEKSKRVKKEAEKIRKKKEEGPVDDSRLKAATPDVGEDEGEGFDDEDYTPKALITPETLSEHIQITTTSQGYSEIFDINGWNKKAGDIRKKPDGWGEDSGLYYYKKSVSGRAGDNFTIWFRERPNAQVKRQIELFFKYNNKIDFNQLARILNGETVYDSAPANKDKDIKDLVKERLKDLGLPDGDLNTIITEINAIPLDADTEHIKGAIDRAFAVNDAANLWLQSNGGLKNQIIVAIKNKKNGASPRKSNFSNGTDIDGVKSQAELEAGAASSSFTATLTKRENRAKTRELYGLIESKFGKKVNNAADAVAELIKPEHELDLSSNNLDMVIEQIKHCRK